MIPPTLTLLQIAEAILDPDNEARAENAASVEAIHEYTFGALGHVISDNSAKMIHRCCRAWLSYVNDTELITSYYEHEYSCRVASPIKEYQRASEADRPAIMTAFVEEYDNPTKTKETT